MQCSSVTTNHPQTMKPKLPVCDQLLIRFLKFKKKAAQVHNTINKSERCTKTDKDARHWIHNKAKLFGLKY